MASGPIHDAAAQRLLHYAIIAGARTPVAGGDPTATGYLLTGLLLGRIAGPDVRDQHQVKNEGERQAMQDFGPLLGKLWTLYWTPLAAIIPHRHVLSHLPILSTAVAFLYLFVPWLYLAHWLLAPDLPASAWISAWLSSDAARWIFRGWAAQDTLHWWLDDRPLKFGPS